MSYRNAMMSAVSMMNNCIYGLYGLTYGSQRRYSGGYSKMPVSLKNMAHVFTCHTLLDMSRLIEYSRRHGYLFNFVHKLQDDVCPDTLDDITRYMPYCNPHNIKYFQYDASKKRRAEDLSIKQIISYKKNTMIKYLTLRRLIDIIDILQQVSDIDVM